MTQRFASPDYRARREEPRAVASEIDFRALQAAFRPDPERHEFVLTRLKFALRHVFRTDFRLDDASTSFESFGVSEASEVSVFPVIDVDAPGARPEPAEDWVQFGDEDTPLELLKTALN